MKAVQTPAACSDADMLLALGQLFQDIGTSVEDLRDTLVSSSEPEQLVHVIPDLLAVIAWRLDLGRRLSGDASVPRSDAQDLFLRADTAARLFARGGAA